MNKSDRIHLYFQIGIIFKTIFAVLEIIGGSSLFFISHNFIVNAVLVLTQNELLEDPHDLIANYLLNASSHIFSSTQYFAAFYLLSHGLVKIIALVGLIKKKLWSYPISIFIFTVFIAYQLYRYTLTHSAWLLILTVIDAVVIWLIWQEFKSVKTKAIEQ